MICFCIMFCFDFDVIFLIDLLWLIVCNFFLNLCIGRDFGFIKIRFLVKEIKDFFFNIFFFSFVVVYDVSWGG